MLHCAKSACCKRMFQRYVVSASYGCYKSKLRCYTCCKSMFQMFHLLVLCCCKCFHVPSVSCECCICCSSYTCMLQVYYSKCFRCFRCMLLVCFIWVLHMFHTYVRKCFIGRCIYFTYMLQAFHLDVAYVLQWPYTCFPGVSYICCKYFNWFGRML
jgi:hypothetical protein